jgi:23S rRNA pseudouridine1911/1915/1917 synthase
VAGLPVLDRFFLHAHRIGFQSPSTGDWIEVESPLAPELEGVLTCLRESV